MGSPERTCIVCRKKDSKLRLQRLVLIGRDQKEGVIDFCHTLSGRAWYMHSSCLCSEKAEKIGRGVINNYMMTKGFQGYVSVDISLNKLNEIVSKLSRPKSIACNTRILDLESALKTHKGASVRKNRLQRFL